MVPAKDTQMLKSVIEKYVEEIEQSFSKIKRVYLSWVFLGFI